MSYGVPVIISGNVGAKDILVQGAGVVIEDIDAQKLFTTLQDITLLMMGQWIEQRARQKDWQKKMLESRSITIKI